MKIKFVILSLLLTGCFSISALAQKGFTKKSDAKNEMKDGKKNGNWVEYMDAMGKATTDTTAPFYSLIVYKAGQRDGLMNEYTKGGKLICSMPYKKGKLNGVAKYYYDDGKLSGETTYKDDNMNGLQKSYYESGKPKSQTTWTNNQPGKTENFDDKK